MGKNKPLKLSAKKKKKSGFVSKERTIIFIEKISTLVQKRILDSICSKMVEAPMDDTWEEMAKRASRGKENQDMRGK